MKGIKKVEKVHREALSKSQKHESLTEQEGAIIYLVQVNRRTNKKNKELSKSNKELYEKLRSIREILVKK